MCEALISAPGLIVATKDVALPCTGSVAVDGASGIVELEILGTAMTRMSTGMQDGHSSLICDIISIHELMEIGEIKDHGNCQAERWTARYDMKALHEPQYNLGDTLNAGQVIQLVGDHNRRRVVQNKLSHDELHDRGRHRGCAVGNRHCRRA